MGALISYENLADDATLTNSSDGTNVLAVSRLQTRQVGKAFRQTLSAASPLESVIVDADLGSAQNINYVGIFGHDIPAGSYRVDLGTSAGASDVATSSGTLWQGGANDPKNQHVIFAQTYSARHVRVTLTPDAAQTVNWGRLWVDAAWTPRVSIRFEHTVMDPSRVERTIGQSVYAYVRPRYRLNRITFPYLTEAEALGDSSDATARSAHHMDMTAGISSSIVVIPETGGADPEQVRHKLGLYGIIRKSTPLRVLAAKSGAGWTYAKDFEVAEER